MYYIKYYNKLRWFSVQLIGHRYFYGICPFDLSEILNTIKNSDTYAILDYGYIN